MIIKRVEKDDKIKTIYKSSNILASTYDKTTKNLNIIFNNGGSYTYKDVKATDYTRFEIADSQGKVFNSHIKMHEFEKNDKVDTTLILEEIKKIEATALTSMGELMVKEMYTLLNHYEIDGKIGEEQLEKVQAVMAKYNEIKNGPKDEQAG